MKILNKILIVIVILFITTKNTFSEKVFMWEVNSSKGKVFLLGSIHLGKESYYPLDKRIYDAFSSTEYLVVEANINKPGSNSILDKAYLPKGVTLDSILKKENYELLLEKFKSYKIPSSMWKSMKPWFATIFLLQLDLQKSGFSADYGIDMHFIKKMDSNKVLELESLDEQFKIFEALAKINPDDFIVYSLKDWENNKKSLDSIYAAWKIGNSDAIEKLINNTEINDEKYSFISEELLYKRNQNMTKKIEAFLESDKTYFVIVGAAHLIGENGIINKLSNLNKYKIEQK